MWTHNSCRLLSWRYNRIECKWTLSPANALERAVTVTVDDTHSKQRYVFVSRRSNLLWFRASVQIWLDLGAQSGSLFGMERERSFFHIHPTAIMDTLIDAYQTRVPMRNSSSSLASRSRCSAIRTGRSTSKTSRRRLSVDKLVVSVYEKGRCVLSIQSRHHSGCHSAYVTIRAI